MIDSCLQSSSLLLPVKNIGVKFSLPTSTDCQVLLYTTLDLDNSNSHANIILNRPQGLSELVKAFIALVPIAKVCFVNVATWHFEGT